MIDWKIFTFFYKLPYFFVKMLQQQTEACKSMIEEKNKLINDLQTVSNKF